jgi:hypothetical protein
VWEFPFIPLTVLVLVVFLGLDRGEEIEDEHEHDGRTNTDRFPLSPILSPPLPNETDNLRRSL